MKRLFSLETLSSFFLILKSKFGLQQFAAVNTNISHYFSETATIQHTYSNDYGSSSVNTKKIKRFFRNTKYLPFAIVFVLVLMITVLSYKIIASRSPRAVAGASDQRLAVKPPLSQQTLNREFSFPLNDASGKQVSQLQYVIQNAELRDTIIIQGQQAVAVQGRAFLILNLKITNSYDKSVKINARDYVRLIVDSSNEKLAPDIHNDPVEVQAISTKYTRLGFPIDQKYKSLVLQVGEITGQKQLIPLNLK